MAETNGQAEEGARKQPTSVVVEAVPLSLAQANDDASVQEGARKTPTDLVVDAVPLSEASP